MEKVNITIIGCGNLGMALTKGFLRQSETVNLTVTGRTLKSIVHLEKFGVRVTTDNKQAVLGADMILVAVKPFRVISILEEIGQAIQPDQKLISMAPGVFIAEMQNTVPHCKAIYRAMPNVAASVGESVTCLCNRSDSTENQEKVLDVFKILGNAFLINEELMDAATVIGACGTAFALRFIRAMVQAGIQIGFDSKTATSIANQTVKGAAQILIEGGEHPEAAIDRVTTPKGITITGLNEMENQGFSAALIQGILASYRKFEK